MIETGDRAPSVTAPMATPGNAGARGEYTSDHVETFHLAEALEAGPAVLAFFPGVYSRTCTEELCQLRDWHGVGAELDAAVYGVSADTPWAQLAFVDEFDLSYPLLSGFNNSVIADYGLRREAGPLAGVADRAVFVVAPDGTVSYRWVVREPQVFPDYGAIEASVEAVQADS